MIDLLANPIWHSLSTRHANLALGNHLAKRYPEDIGPLSGISEQSTESWEALKSLISPGEYAVLFLNAPANPTAGLTITKHFAVDQMLCESSRGLSSTVEVADLKIAELKIGDLKIEDLGEGDVPEMVALAALTEPGPFRHRTIQLGGYRGIRDGGRLVAMAGQRTAFPGYREVSAVCTHPSYRGKGYAAALVCAVSEGIAKLGESPYLHVRQDNFSAIALYRRLGYQTTRTFHGVVVAHAKAEEL